MPVSLRAHARTQARVHEREQARVPVPAPVLAPPPIPELFRPSRKEIELLKSTAKFPCVCAVKYSPGIDAQRGDLLIIEVHPSEGFTHFVKKQNLGELYKKVGLYHISICFTSNLDSYRLKYGNEIVDECIKNVFDEYDGIEFNLDLSFGNGGTCAYINDPSDSLYWLHSNGSYSDRYLHISM